MPAYAKIISILHEIEPDANELLVESNCDDMIVELLFYRFFRLLEVFVHMGNIAYRTTLFCFWISDVVTEEMYFHSSANNIIKNFWSNSQLI